MKRRYVSLGIILLLLAALLAACGAGGSKQQAAKDSAAPVPAGAPQEASKGPNQTNGAAAPAQPIADRKLVLNAQFDLRIKDADDATNRISQAVRTAGGYIQETRQTGTKQQGRTVSIIVRVPSGQYGSIVDLVTGLGEVTSRREWTQDVTEQYVDLDQRIQAKRVQLEQLRKLYERTGTVKEMMELESEINRVQSDLESMEGRMRVLSNQVDFSTVTVNLYEPGVPAPLEAPKTLAERISRSFTQSWRGLVNFTFDLIVMLAGLIPIVVYLAIPTGAGYLLYRRFKRK